MDVKALGPLLNFFSQMAPFARRGPSVEALARAHMEQTTFGAYEVSEFTLPSTFTLPTLDTTTAATIGEYNWSTLAHSLNPLPTKIALMGLYLVYQIARHAHKFPGSFEEKAARAFQNRVMQAHSPTVELDALIPTAGLMAKNGNIVKMTDIEIQPSRHPQLYQFTDVNAGQRYYLYVQKGVPAEFIEPELAQRMMGTPQPTAKGA